MVVKIKNIKIIIIGVGINDKYQADVTILDNKGRVVFCGKTKRGRIYLDLKPYRVYFIKVSSCLDYLLTSFYVNSNSEYIFVLNRSIKRRNITPGGRTITFLLTDSNYENLKIEKGEMVLWQR